MKVSLSTVIVVLTCVFALWYVFMLATNKKKVLKPLVVHYEVNGKPKSFSKIPVQETKLYAQQMLNVLQMSGRLFEPITVGDMLGMFSMYSDDVDEAYGWQDFNNAVINNTNSCTELWLGEAEYLKNKKAKK